MIPDAVHRLIAAADRLLILTGAGVSAESGVPTFRGNEGLWQRFRPEELATLEAFRADPRRSWEWYGWRREQLAACRPNPAHLAIARHLLEHGGTLVTQNVDGLHELAALEAAEGDAARAEPAMPVRLHGSIFRVRCTGCAYRAAHREPIDARSAETLPHCPECDSLLRPDVVWFGELLPADALQRAEAAAGVADVCVVVGTRGAVYPAAGVAFAAQAAGAALVVVDPEETAFDVLADVRLTDTAARAVPVLLGGAG